MALSDLDSIVLGHNQFFGVDHLSQERGAARAEKFENPDAILEMIRLAMRHGAGGLMMSTHPRATTAAELMRSEPALSGQLGFYPLLPYVAKYVRQSNEKGLVNLVMDQVKGGGLGEKIGLFARGSMAMLRKDMFQILKTLVQMELMPFKELNVKAVFLHDVLTDLALALDMRSVFEFYCEDISDRFNAEPAFATKNLPMLAQKFQAWNIQRPLLLCHVNKAGFSMCPSREACEKALSSYDVQVMAMGTLASGFLKPDEAYEYVLNVPNIESVVVGVSTPKHAEETFGAIRKHMSADRATPEVVTVNSHKTTDVAALKA